MLNLGKIVGLVFSYILLFSLRRVLIRGRQVLCVNLRTESRDLNISIL